MDDYEATLVVDWFLEIEQRLSNLLQITRLTPSSRELPLPPLANVIVDAGSLVDTVFRDNCVSRKKRKNLGIVDFHIYFEPLLNLSRQHSVILEVPLETIAPFADWNDPATGDYSAIDWWQDYNKLKHDRIAEHSRATMMTAIKTVCALQQVLSFLPEFKKALLSSDLLSFGDWSRAYALDVIQDPQNKEVTVLVESKLFVTPVGVEQFPEDPKKISGILVHGSRKLVRFLGPPF